MPVLKSLVEGILYCHVSHIVVTKLHVKTFIKIPSANNIDRNSSVTIYTGVSFMNLELRMHINLMVARSCYSYIAMDPAMFAPQECFHWRITQLMCDIMVLFYISFIIE